MSFGFEESRVSMGQQMYRHDAILNTKNILTTRASQDFMHVCIRQMIYKRDVIKIGIGNLTHIPDFNLTLTLKTKSTSILKFISWFMISVYAISMYKISGLAKLCTYIWTLYLYSGKIMFTRIHPESPFYILNPKHLHFGKGKRHWTKI